MVVEPDADKVQHIIDALIEGGWQNVRALGSIEMLQKVINDFAPDIVLIDMANPDRDTLEHVIMVSDTQARAVALFVDQTDAGLTQAALTAGVSAYVVDGLHMHRIKPVLDTAIARFQMMRQMRSELDAAKQALTDRKTIDRAKGIVMRQRGVSEDEAYTLLRQAAMGQGRKIIDVAHALVTSADLLG
ncbi:ANTAR domain-containing protein [Parasphingorhabdus sp.]|uniref:ANTAR domain-containing response regulator n=1 Tax=Parasphingorhabdus sp. TaxID=2709688 RepID=UPI00329901FF